MRISDWSSDVCSSDLGRGRRNPRAARCSGCAVGASGSAHATSNRRDRRGDRDTSFGRRCWQRRRLKKREADDLFATWFHEGAAPRSEEHTSELQSLMRISYAVFCLKKKKITEDYDTI